ncbi:hypothetical protein GQ55_1G348500 [Panicum hallii var. hallii]|uniref:Myb/SANT-like domain-containing protein n=1 Tax=Panicum hallii var. hallii TaxID=1504633 RepID=A0A2T7FAP9_9POAL|nr:hypothetical protein GQ55_1G348500 [Panicum hallii var. hallii]
MGKGKEKDEGDGTTRERTILWDEDQTKFMLGWFIDYIKEQHAGFKIKKQHHFKCSEALNRQFNMGVTATQFIRTALSKSGNTFDTSKSMVIISESEKANLQFRARRLLSKPIKFFNEMQELFLNSSADGSLALDANTCMNETQADEDNDYDDDVCNDLSSYAPPEDNLGDDSNTLPSPIIKRLRSEGKAPKRDVRPKSRMSRVGDAITSTLVELENEIKKPPPPPPPMRSSDDILWQRLEHMTLTTDQKLMVGTFLASKEQNGIRSFLSGSSEVTFQSWIFKFLTDSGL